MARIGSPKDFWNTLKSVSAAEIAQEANRPLAIAVVGETGQRAALLETLFAKKTTTTALSLEVRSRETPSTLVLQEFGSYAEESGFPKDPKAFDLVLDVGTDRRLAPEGTLVYPLSDLGGTKATLERILEDLPELELALAKSLPAFRPQVAEHIIAQTATANAQFALLTGITAAFPLAGILLPVNALSDIVVLTKNQAMMALRLAAIYDLPVDYLKRSKELAPILGNAVGWRAIAREIVGMIPLGGFLAKAMIAYAGTVMVGRAAQVYYETGENLSRAELKRLYLEAYHASRERVKKLADSMRGRRGKRSVAPEPKSEPLALTAAEDILEAELLPLDAEPISEPRTRQEPLS